MATTTLQRIKPLGPRDAGIPLTLAEFEAANFQPGPRYELIHGVLVVSPAPLEEERDANEELGHWLRNYQESHPQGAALDLTLHEHDVRTKTNSRRCDRAIWAGLGRLPRTRGPAAKRDRPSIIAEFPSSRPADQRRDYQEKTIEYRNIKVQEYWIIDRFRRTATIYRWRGKRWVKQVVKEGEVYQTPLLPGFELPLAKLLAVSDKYRRSKPAVSDQEEESGLYVVDDDLD
jgi:Uma2 family endonuclease